MSEEGEQDGQERSHAPSRQKLQRSREKGDVAYSPEVTTAATYAGIYIVLLVAGGWAVSRILGVLQVFFSRPHEVGSRLVSEGKSGFAQEIVTQLMIALSPVFGALALCAILSVVAQKAVVFAPSKLKPKLNRISIIDNAKQKYGPHGLFEFLKSFMKLSAIMAIVAFAIKDRFLELPGLARLPVQAFGDVIFRETVFFLGLITCAAALIAAIDYPWRRYRHEKKLRMTFEELKKESKESEGDPAMKGARRERAQAAARNRMMVDVPKANVVIVNPTHYAVALQWDRESGAAPVCVAKGVDNIAARIRELAAEAGVPIRRDPPTARSIYAAVDIGEEVKSEHYAAVAAAIHYAQEVRRKAKAIREG